MKRPVVVLSGLVLGVSLGVLLGACGGYFECQTFHDHIETGGYDAPASFELVIDADRRVVTTDIDSRGVEVRAVYTLGPERRTPQAQ